MYDRMNYRKVRNRTSPRKQRDFKMFKMITTKGRLTKTARDAFQGAFIAGVDNEMIVFPNAYTDDYKFKRVSDLMESINIAWYEFNGDMYVYRRWFSEALSDLSERALAEVKNLIG